MSMDAHRLTSIALRKAPSTTHHEAAVVHRALQELLDSGIIVVAPHAETQDLALRLEADMARSPYTNPLEEFAALCDTLGVTREREAAIARVIDLINLVRARTAALERIAGWLETSRGKLSPVQIREILACTTAALSSSASLADALEGLGQTALMLRAWVPEIFPKAHAQEQAHFGRVMMEGAADLIEEALAALAGEPALTPRALRRVDHASGEFSPRMWAGRETRAANGAHLEAIAASHGYELACCRQEIPDELDGARPCEILGAVAAPVPPDGWHLVGRWQDENGELINWLVRPTPAEGA